MTQHYLIGLMFLLTCFCWETASRPSNNESPANLEVEVPVEIPVEDQKEQRSLPEDEVEVQDNIETRIDNTRDILEKIKAINEKLKRPHRQQINFNPPPYPSGGYILDKTILEKIQQIIASGKLHGSPGAQKEHETNSLNDDINQREQHSKALRYIQPTLSSNSINGPVTVMSVPYMTSVPVLVMPNVGSQSYLANNDLNSIRPNEYSTRQGPSFPFQVQWPLAPFFPVLVKDPLLHYLTGGTWENFIEYGQNADVCNRKQKSADDGNSINENISEESVDHQMNNDFVLNPVNYVSPRQGRKLNKKIKKRTVSKRTASKSVVPLQTLDDVKHIQNIFAKPLAQVKPSTAKPLKKVTATQDNIKQAYADDEGDLRTPFSDFTWFGNRKPTAPSPGFFINRLRVRKGGVAIAGPGGVATAGRGGAAIVGPGGLAYTQPGGLAVAGPAARVVALTSDADLNSVITRLQQQSATDGSVPRLLAAIPEGKVVATGPVVKHLCIYTICSPSWSFRLISIIFCPSSSLRVQYLPFYGGAKGQYLEVKTNDAGVVVSERIVSEEKISSENIVKNTEENLLAKVLGANLQNIKTLSSSVLRLHNLGRKTGGLNDNDKARFKSELYTLGDVASNIIKLIEEVGDNVDVLFKSNASKRQYQNEEDVGEEGVGIDNPESGHPQEIPFEILGGATIAEAKPVGLAVVGENGLASSRPMATAVAASGIAIARPVGTAIAGLDPSLLGIDFQLNKN